jgi:hypothetical protein
MIYPSVDTQSPFTPALAWDRWWWVFCFLIVCLKFSLLGIDPHPQMFMGDSGSYLWTALSGWIPPDRSFLYGFVIGWVALSTHSLESLLVLQAFVGAGIAILLAFLCRNVLFLSSRLSYGAAFVCAIDPLQLVWERYLMTETISLLLYALMLVFCLSYLRQRKLWQLALVQILAVLAISFRISYLLVVEATAVVLPIIAFLPLLWRGHVGHSRDGTAKFLGTHLALSILLMLGLHLGYKQLNGRLSGRPPAYLYSSGLSIMATWAPALRPTDAPDARLSNIISQGSQFHLTDPRQRNSQLYSDDHLIARWKDAEPDLAHADQIAKQTALHALLHRPMSVLALGTTTFLDYFHPRQIHQQALSDLGTGEWPTPAAEKLAGRLRYTPPSPLEARSHTILQTYLLSAQPYYYIVALSPFLCGALLFFVRETFILFLFIHASIFLGTNSLLAVTASVRYLQPLSFLTILVAFVFADHLLRRPPPFVLP